MKTQTVETVAAQMVRMGAHPEIVASRYRLAAADMRKVATKAASSRNGKHRGYTAEDALRLAEMQDDRAVTVPAEMQRIAKGGR